MGELLEKNKASIVARTAGQHRTVASHEDAPPAPTHVAKKSAAFRIAVGLVWCLIRRSWLCLFTIDSKMQPSPQASPFQG